VNSDLIPGRNAVRDAIRSNLGKHYSVNDIGHYDLDIAQYEILCNMYSIVPRQKETMLVLYFNGRATQIPFEQPDMALEQGFRNLGWSPLDIRINTFLQENPNNQEALAVLFTNEFANLSKLFTQARIDMLYPSIAASMRLQIPIENLTPDSDTIPSITRTLQKINKAGSMGWANTQTSSMTLNLLMDNGTAVLALMEDTAFSA
jgi:hypothetical protein